MPDQIYISEYLKSRRFNSTRYAAIIARLNKECQQILDKRPGLKICMSMSAKYQNTYIYIEENDEYPERADTLAEIICNVLEEFCFEGVSVDDDGEKYHIDYQD